MKILHEYKFTFEVILVVAFTALFLFFLHLRPELFTVNIMNSNIIETLKYDNGFRACVAREDKACINKRLSFLLQNKPFIARVSWDFSKEMKPSDLPQDYIEEEIFITGNSTVYNPALIKVYYWEG